MNSYTLCFIGNIPFKIWENYDFLTGNEWIPGSGKFLYTYISLDMTNLFLFLQGAVQEMLNLSQQEYVSRIDELNQALILAWEKDQRVKALKIAIQVNITSQVLLL